MVMGWGSWADGLKFELRILSNGSYLMAAVNKSVLVGYSAAQMFALVDRVEDYPLFLPWCGGVNVQRPDADSMVASLSIHYHGIKQTFTTRNTSVSPVFIKMNLVDGPFKRLEGTWS